MYITYPIQNILEHASQIRLYTILVSIGLALYEIPIILSIVFSILYIYFRYGFCTKKNCSECGHSFHKNECQKITSHEKPVFSTRNVEKKFPIHSTRLVDKKFPIIKYSEPYKVMETKYKIEEYSEWKQVLETKCEPINEKYVVYKKEYYWHGTLLKHNIIPITGSNLVYKDVTKYVDKLIKKTRQVPYKVEVTKQDKYTAGYETKKVSESYISSYETKKVPEKYVSSYETIEIKCGCKHKEKNYYEKIAPIIFINSFCVGVYSIFSLVVFGLLIFMTLLLSMKSWITWYNPIFIIIVSLISFNIMFSLITGISFLIILCKFYL